MKKLSAGLEAIVDLRRVIEINPENADARGMLMEQELYWLREIAAKVDIESRASIEARPAGSQGQSGRLIASAA